MADEFSSFADASFQPARNGAVVTPHDSNALSDVSKGLYVGGAGNITLRFVDDSADTLFTAVPVGTVLPIRVSHIRATGTTATAIVNLY